MNYSKDGASASDIVKVAQLYGLNGEVLSGTFSELKKEINDSQIKLPAILHIVEDTGQGHFIVLWKLKKDFLFCFDPKIGNQRIQDTEFMKKWTGVIIVFEEGEETFQKSNAGKAQYYGKYFKFLFDKRLVFKIIVFSILASAMSILNSLFLRTIIDEYVMNFFNSNVTAQYGSKLLTIAFLLLLIFYISQSSIFLIRDLATTKLSNQVSNKFSTMYMKKILDISQLDFEKFEIGELLTRFENLQQLQRLSVNIILIFFNEILSFIFSVFFLFRISTSMTMSVILLSVFYLILFITTIPKLEYSIKKYFSLYSSTLTNVTNILRGKQVLRTLNKERWHSLRFLKMMRETNLQIYKIGVFRSYLDAAANLLDAIGNGLILWQGIILVVNNHLTLGELVAFQSLIILYMAPIKNFAALQSDFQNIKVIFQRLDDLFEMKNSNKLYITERPLAESEPLSIVIENASFSIFNKEILKNINLEIHPGEKVQIRGDNGSGKSTILKIISGIYPIKSGKISLGGISYNLIDTQDLYSKLQYVGQDSYFIEGSVLDNILMGNGNKEETNSKIFEYLSILGIKSSLDKEQFLSQRIREDENTLSSGDKQRVELIRSLILKPKILVIDEGMVHLDFDSRNRLLDNLLSDTELTLVYVSHENNNRVFNKEYIIENGTVTQK
ncbi:ATP-binding cassette domain-containing protein [Streptococcus suis]